MIISPLESGQQFSPLIQQLQSQGTDNKIESESFADTIKDFIQDVNSTQLDAKELQQSFIKGEPVDLHNVMIAAEKAKTSFQLLLEIRNKFLDMYQQINRMQV